MSVKFYQTPQRHLPQDCGLHGRRCEDVRSRKNEYSAHKTLRYGFSDVIRLNNRPVAARDTSLRVWTPCERVAWRLAR
jgi:hypothetical protein